MAVRIKQWIIPYTWWDGIEITNNHVINVLLRELNNLIHVNGDRELYVDLQLDDWITPDDDFPVGVTTWRILQEDWWEQTGTILNWKTTSWDQMSLIYANDGKLYYSVNLWPRIEIGSGGGSAVWVATALALGTIKLGSDTKQTEPAQTPSSTTGRTYAVQLNNDNQAMVNVPRTDTTYTAGQNVSIVNGEINVTLPQVLVYKWTVNDLSDLPSSWQSVWDTYFVEWEDWMYSWNGTSWEYVWWTGIDISNLFNKVTDTTDDITQWTTHLFCTQQEKTYWNWKQDAISAGTWIDITNNVVSNTKPFDPENAWALWQYLEKTSTGYKWNTIKQFNPANEWSTGQVLKKTATGYEWQNESWWGWGGWWGTSYTAWDGIAITWHVISNTKPFEPWNWTVGQVLTKTADGYEWMSSSSNVKCFEIDLTTVTDAEIREITGWINTGTDYWAIVKAQQDVFTYSHSVVLNWEADYYFYSPKYTIDATTTANWDYTTLYNSMLHINYNYAQDEYTIEKDTFNNYANFILANDSRSTYTTPFMATQDYQPATKAYVDSRNWTWTLSQYNALTEIDPDVVYNITSLS